MLLSQLCVISAYIKRRANLVLLSEDQTEISARELESCLRESLSNLQLCGVMTHLTCGCDGNASVQQIISLYDCFEDVLEALLTQLTAIAVFAEYKEDSILLRIQAGCREIPTYSPNPLLPGGVIHAQVQDQDLIIEATIKQGGNK